VLVFDSELFNILKPTCYFTYHQVKNQKQYMVITFNYALCMGLKTDGSFCHIQLFTLVLYNQDADWFQFSAIK